MWTRTRQITVTGAALCGAVIVACRGPAGGGRILDQGAVVDSSAGRVRAASPERGAASATQSLRSPSTGDTTEYVVMIAGRIAGELRQWPDSGGAVTTDYRYDDRGRGPALRQRLVTDRAGMPIAMQLSGTDYLRNPVGESVRIAPGPLLTWRNGSAAGRTKPGAGYYLPIETLPSDLAALARALLLSRTRSVALLPDGIARITSGAPRSLTAGASRVAVTPHEITGLGLTPQTVWTSSDGRLFAVGDSWQLVIRRGFESVAPMLLSAQSAGSRQRDSLTAARLARRPTRPVAIVHANLFDAVAKRMVPRQTVVVRGDRITAVGADNAVEIPADAERIDAAGRALLPGLWDMHVHLSDEDGLLHLAAGVTTVRDLANDTDELLARRARFDAGTLLGPQVIAAGIIDGPGPFAAPTTTLVATRDDARAAVDAYAAKGYEQIKVYSSLDPALLSTIVRAADQRGLRVSGHVPYGMTAEQFVRAGADEIQHANFLFLNFLGDSIDTRTPARFTAVAQQAGSLDLRSERVARFIALLKERDIVVDPTLNIFEQMLTARAGTLDAASLPLAPRFPAVARRALLTGGLPATAKSEPVYRSSFIAMERMVRFLHDAGVRIVAGTDASAGFSLHRELELYAEAGIPNVDVLALATLGAAQVMKKDADVGSLTAGKRADLVLIDGDPSQRMRDLRRAELVMKGGVLFVPDSLYASVGVKPAPRKGAIPTREVRAEDVVCRSPAVAVRKGSTDPVPLQCSVADSAVTGARNGQRSPPVKPARRAPRRPVSPR